MNIIKNAKRIVFKIGSSSLTHETGRLDLHRMEHLARVLSDFKNAGKDVVLVSSAAITAGRSKLNLDHRPASIAEKQAMAAVGQCELMAMYERFFGFYGHPVAQILLTKDVSENPIPRQNAINTFETLLSMNCVPIVNENDTVAFEEIEFGDNDTLSAHVAVLCKADALVILSDIDGLYDSNPRENPNARLVPTVAKIDDRIRAMAGGAGSDFGTGGVITKIKAAEIVCKNGIPMFIINGDNPERLYDLFEGQHIGTYFMTE